MKLACLIVLLPCLILADDWTECAIPDHPTCKKRCDPSYTDIGFDKKKCCKFCSPPSKMRRTKCLAWCQENQEHLYLGCTMDCIRHGFPQCHYGKCVLQ